MEELRKLEKLYMQELVRARLNNWGESYTKTIQELLNGVRQDMSRSKGRVTENKLVKESLNEWDNTQGQSKYDKHGVYYRTNISPEEDKAQPSERTLEYAQILLDDLPGLEDHIRKTYDIEDVLTWLARRM